MASGAGTPHSGVDIFGPAWLSSEMRRRRRWSSSSSSKKPAKDFKKLVRMAWVGCLPPDAPLQQRLVKWFAKAGFKDIRVDINSDVSMVSFWLQKGEDSEFITNEQVHGAIYQMLRKQGVNLMPYDLFTLLDGASVKGAFCPTVLPDGQVLPLFGAGDAGDSNPALN